MADEEVSGKAVEVHFAAVAKQDKEETDKGEDFFSAEAFDDGVVYSPLLSEFVVSEKHRQYHEDLS